MWSQVEGTAVIFLLTAKVEAVFQRVASLEHRCQESSLVERRDAPT